MWDFWRNGKSFINLQGLVRPTSHGSMTSVTSTESLAGGEERSRAGSTARPQPLDRLVSREVYFKDLRATVGGAALPRQPSGQQSPLVVEVEKDQLVIVMVGLPGRGKTFLCNKLKCFLNWLGHRTMHFNVGQYRRKCKGDCEQQDASFFDPNNKAGLEARERVMRAALDDMLACLDRGDCQVAIFDATNSTQLRRQFLVDNLSSRGYVHVFLESVCQDHNALMLNYLNKLTYSPDYSGCDKEQALADFKARIAAYEAVYETITDRAHPYIKLCDMVTGHGYMDLNRIAGYISGKIVYHLMQVCKAGLSNSVRRLWLTRHGESVFNEQSRVGGDSGLTERGDQYAQLLPGVLAARLPRDEAGNVASLTVWTSTLTRTVASAQYIPGPKLRWKALDEIDAGLCDGLTAEEIAAHFPDLLPARAADKLRCRYPRGESYLDVIQRLEPVIAELERGRECICIVAHQAVLRCLYSYFMARPQEVIPELPIPLHTIIELTTMPDGTMREERFQVPVPTHADLQALVTEPLGQCLAQADLVTGPHAAAGAGACPLAPWQPATPGMGRVSLATVPSDEPLEFGQQARPGPEAQLDSLWAPATPGKAGQVETHAASLGPMPDSLPVGADSLAVGNGLRPVAVAVRADGLAQDGMGTRPCRVASGPLADMSMAVAVGSTAVAGDPPGSPLSALESRQAVVA